MNLIRARVEVISAHCVDMNSYAIKVLRAVQKQVVRKFIIEEYLHRTLSATLARFGAINAGWRASHV